MVVVVAVAGFGTSSFTFKVDGVHCVSASTGYSVRAEELFKLFVAHVVLIGITREVALPLHLFGHGSHTSLCLRDRGRRSPGRQRPDGSAASYPQP